MLKRAAAAVLGSIVSDRFPFAGQTNAADEDLTELLINGTWRPALQPRRRRTSVYADAGNVLRPSTQLQLSIRTPPTVDAEAAFLDVNDTGRRTSIWSAGTVYGQRCIRLACAHASALASQSADDASQSWFGREWCTWVKGAQSRLWVCLARRFRVSIRDYRCSRAVRTRTGPMSFALAHGQATTGCVAQLIESFSQRQTSE